MSKAKKTYKIPFSKHTGEMLSYTWGCDESNPNIDWKDNYVFDDELKYVSYIGGRSSMSMKVESLRDGRRYNMFWTYFDDCIRRDNNGPGPTFSGKWTFVKTGQNYSVKPVVEYEE